MAEPNLNPELHARLRRAPGPAVDSASAARWTAEVFGIQGTCSDLPSYIDRNFRIDQSQGASWVLRISNEEEDEACLELQNLMMARLERDEPGIAPTVCRSLRGREIEPLIGNDGREHLARLVSFMPGQLLAKSNDCVAETWRSLGDLLGRMDRAFVGLTHPAQHRQLRWDLARASWTISHSRCIEDAAQRALVERVQLQYFGQVQRRVEELPKALIYNDANDQNLVLRETQGVPLVSAVFDFGDVVHSARIFELAVASAYAIFGQGNPLAIMGELCAGYDKRWPLEDVELEVLLPATCMRLAQSVCISAGDAALDPDNEYVNSSSAPAWLALERLSALDPDLATSALRTACGRDSSNDPAPVPLTSAEIQDLRQDHLGPSLSLSYRDSIRVVRGRGAWLFDGAGRAYLDGVNNVCHVGHCHPHVVAAGQRQMAELNTNTRYLHGNIARYARRLTGLFPEPLSVCYFVNSGSEANELAVRLARTFTGRHDMLTIGGGYHGNTSTLIDLSPYKHGGPGGQGAPDWSSSVTCPDLYRGPHRRTDPQAGLKYAAEVREACERSATAGAGIAAFLAEPLIGCGGQIVPPQGYLTAAFEHARGAGALCIADEVQIGFGRVGRHWWGFELDGAVPDIVTLGKPMGNGHPMAAVITTPAIAEAFANGMEYFNTFGGNPVSCAIGLAVLDVIEGEGLRQLAVERGIQLLAGFKDLAESHACIGDVRGVGLYLGVEIVKDREGRVPDPERLARAIETARQSGVLFSSDGPDHNVLKIKPPMCWTAAEADLALTVMDRALR